MMLSNSPTYITDYKCHPEIKSFVENYSVVGLVL